MNELWRGILSEPEAQGALTSAPITANRGILAQVLKARETNPRPNVTDVFGFGPTWADYGHGLLANLLAKFPTPGATDAESISKTIGLLGLGGSSLGLITKVAPKVALRIGGRIYEANPGEVSHGQILNRLAKEQPETIAPRGQPTRTIEDGWAYGPDFLTRSEALNKLGYADTQK